MAVTLRQTATDTGGKATALTHQEMNDNLKDFLTFTTATTSAGPYTISSVFAPDFNSTSDVRLKENITSMSGLELVRQLNPVQFTWKDSGKKSYGLIAQEIENIFPELTTEREDGTKGVSYIPIIAMLVDSVKKLEARVIELENNKGTVDGN